MNANTPPLQVKVRGDYLGIDKPYEHGTLVSVKALSNQALQFSVLLESGALYTGIPINMLVDLDSNCDLTLSNAQMYDNIGSVVSVIVLDLLRYMTCTVKLNSGDIVKGKYLFTIDFEDFLARHPVQWKQFHVISTSRGWVAYPQYRIRFTDEALCPNQESGMNYSYNTKIHLSEE